MRVGLRLQPCNLGRVFLGPDLRPTKEEALLGRKAVDVRRTRLSLKRFHESVIRYIEPAEVGNGFARYELALKMQARLRFKTTELVDDAIGARIEVFLIALGPPVLQVPLRIKFATLIVVAMRDLMANDCTDGAVVDRVIGVGVEKRRLQNSCGEGDVVVERVVTGVDSWRRHAPLGSINRFVDLVEVAHLIKLTGAQHIRQVRISGDIER